MKTTMLMLMLLLFAAAAYAQPDGCSNGSPICLGCPPPTGCMQCHGGDNGEFYMQQIPDPDGQVRNKFFCGCSCQWGVSGGVAAQATKPFDPTQIRHNERKFTDYGRQFLTSLTKGLPLSLFSVFNPPTINAKGEFLNAHMAAAKNIDTACGRNTINRILASHFLK